AEKQLNAGSGLLSFAALSCSCLKHAALLEPFLFPGIALIVVARLLPESRAIFAGKLQRAKPLGALPEIARRDERPQWEAVIGREELAAKLVREQHVLFKHDVERHVCRVVILAVCNHEAYLRREAEQFYKIADAHAFPNSIEHAPPRDAVDVGLQRDGRQRQELVPCPAHLALDL